MPTTAQVTCNCGTTTLVFPPALREHVPAAAQIGAADLLAAIEDDDGLRFAIANEAGHYTCASCGGERYAPQIELNKGRARSGGVGGSRGASSRNSA